MPRVQYNGQTFQVPDGLSRQQMADHINQQISSSQTQQAPAPQPQQAQPQPQATGSRDDVEAGLDAASQKYGVPRNLLGALASQESNHNPNAKAKGSTAHGVGQIINGTWKQYGYTDDQRNDVNAQTDAMGKIMADLYKKSGGSWKAATYGYNQGEGAMQSYLRGNQIPSGASYVDAVNRRLQDLQSMSKSGVGEGGPTTQQLAQTSQNQLQQAQGLTQQVAPQNQAPASLPAPPRPQPGQEGVIPGMIPDSAIPKDESGGWIYKNDQGSILDATLATLKTQKDGLIATYQDAFTGGASQYRLNMLQKDIQDKDKQMQNLTSTGQFIAGTAAVVPAMAASVVAPEVGIPLAAGIMGAQTTGDVAAEQVAAGQPLNPTAALGAGLATTALNTVLPMGAGRLVSAPARTVAGRIGQSLLTHEGTNAALGAGQQIINNVATDKDIFEGVPQAAGQMAVAGRVMHTMANASKIAQIPLNKWGRKSVADNASLSQGGVNLSDDMKNHMDNFSNVYGQAKAEQAEQSTGSMAAGDMTPSQNMTDAALKHGGMTAVQKALKWGMDNKAPIASGALDFEVKPGLMSDGPSINVGEHSGFTKAEMNESNHAFQHAKPSILPGFSSRAIENVETNAALKNKQQEVYKTVADNVVGTARDNLRMATEERDLRQRQGLNTDNEDHLIQALKLHAQLAQAAIEGRTVPVNDLRSVSTQINHYGALTGLDSKLKSFDGKTVGQFEPVTEVQAAQVFHQMNKVQDPAFQHGNTSKFKDESLGTGDLALGAISHGASLLHREARAALSRRRIRNAKAEGAEAISQITNYAPPARRVENHLEQGNLEGAATSSVDALNEAGINTGTLGQDVVPEAPQVAPEAPVAAAEPTIREPGTGEPMTPIQRAVLERMGINMEGTSFTRDQADHMINLRHAMGEQRGAETAAMSQAPNRNIPQPEPEVQPEVQPQAEPMTAVPRPSRRATTEELQAAAGEQPVLHDETMAAQQQRPLQTAEEQVEAGSQFPESTMTPEEAQATREKYTAPPKPSRETRKESTQEEPQAPEYNPERHAELEEKHRMYRERGGANDHPLTKEEAIELRQQRALANAAKEERASKSNAAPKREAPKAKEEEQPETTATEEAAAEETPEAPTEPEHSAEKPRDKAYEMSISPLKKKLEKVEQNKGLSRPEAYQKIKAAKDELADIEKAIADAASSKKVTRDAIGEAIMALDKNLSNKPEGWKTVDYIKNLLDRHLDELEQIRNKTSSETMNTVNELLSKYRNSEPSQVVSKIDDFMKSRGTPEADLKAAKVIADKMARQAGIPEGEHFLVDDYPRAIERATRERYNRALSKEGTTRTTTGPAENLKESIQRFDDFIRQNGYEDSPAVQEYMDHLKSIPNAENERPMSAVATMAKIKKLADADKGKVTETGSLSDDAEHLNSIASKLGVDMSEGSPASKLIEGATRGVEGKANKPLKEERLRNLINKLHDIATKERGNAAELENLKVNSQKAKEELKRSGATDEQLKEAMDVAKTANRGKEPTFSRVRSELNRIIARDAKVAQKTRAEVRPLLIDAAKRFGLENDATVKGIIAKVTAFGEGKISDSALSNALGRIEAESFKSKLTGEDSHAMMQEYVRDLQLDPEEKGIADILSTYSNSNKSKEWTPSQINTVKTKLRTYLTDEHARLQAFLKNGDGQAVHPTDEAAGAMIMGKLRDRRAAEKRIKDLERADNREAKAEAAFKARQKMHKENIEQRAKELEQSAAQHETAKSILEALKDLPKHLSDTNQQMARELTEAFKAAVPHMKEEEIAAAATDLLNKAAPDGKGAAFAHSKANWEAISKSTIEALKEAGMEKEANAVIGFSNILEKNLRRKEAYPNNSELWMTTDDVEQLRGLVNNLNPGTSHYMGSMGVMMRSRMFGEDSRRNLLSEENVKSKMKDLAEESRQKRAAEEELNGVMSGVSEKPAKTAKAAAKSETAKPEGAISTKATTEDFAREGNNNRGGLLYEETKAAQTRRINNENVPEVKAQEPKAYPTDHKSVQPILKSVLRSLNEGKQKKTVMKVLETNSATGNKPLDATIRALYDDFKGLSAKEIKTRLESLVKSEPVADQGSNTTVTGKEQGTSSPAPKKVAKPKPEKREPTHGERNMINRFKQDTDESIKSFAVHVMYDNPQQIKSSDVDAAIDFAKKHIKARKKKLMDEVYWAQKDRNNQTGVNWKIYKRDTDYAERKLKALEQVKNNLKRKEES